MQCECENSNCQHGYKCCQERPTTIVHTTYGPFKMCGECAETMVATKYCRYTEPIKEVISEI